MISVTIDGVVQEAQAGERLIDIINRSASKVPRSVITRQLGPIRHCDTCTVEIRRSVVQGLRESYLRRTHR